MKIENRFKEKGNSLYTMTDEAISVGKMNIFEASLDSMSDPSFVGEITAERHGGILEKPAIIGINWKTIEPETENYNEAFLADLRILLKKLEDLQIYTIINPFPGQNAFEKASLQRFTACAVHTARRIKDCRSVIGFAIPDAVAADLSFTDFYISELSRKHRQYLFFVSRSFRLKRERIVWY